jgi:7-keto-8-aminopelargonate synthetase-like enzyme
MAAAAARAALEVMRTEPEHRERLWANYYYLRGILESLGVDFWQSPTPALPIVVGEKEKCYWIWKTLWEAGFFTVMSLAPGMPAGRELIRVALTAEHTKQQLDRFGEALGAAMKSAGLKAKP